MFTLIDALPSAIVFVDDDEVIAWNSAATALYGWPAHETIGRSFAELLVDDTDRAELTRVLEEASSRGRWQGDFRIKRRDGALLVSSFLAARVRGPDGLPHTAWVATDIVDQHLAEQERDVLLSAEHAARGQELENTIGLFEALLDCAPIGIAVLDLELNCRQANPTFAAMIGAERSPAGEYLDDLATLPPEVAADLRRVATTGRTLVDRKLQLRQPIPKQPREISANYFPIYEGKSVLSGVGLTWSDITGARLAEGERAELTQRAIDAQRRLAVLSSASSALMATTDIDGLIDRLARVLAPAAAECCVIELIGKTGIIEHVAVSHSDRSRARRLRDSLLDQPAESSPDSPIAMVRRTGRALLFGPDEVPVVLDGLARSDEQRSLFDEFQVTSGITVPIRTRGEVLGILGLANTGDVRLTEDDLDVAVEIAHRAALAVGRAITYHNEHVLAEQLQKALLPKTFDEVAPLLIEVRYSAAADSATVGGDWYDVFRLSPTEVVLVIGDVIGHDTSAAIGMSRLRHLINAFAMESASQTDGPAMQPDQILSRIDHLIHHDSSAWATCIVAVIDTKAGVMRWSSAGHPQPVLARDGTVRLLEDTGERPLLGVTRDTKRATSTITLFEGDRVLLYTDGLFERRRESLEVGLARLVETVRAVSDRPLGRFCDDVMATMLHGVPQTDDIAVLALDFVLGS